MTDTAYLQLRWEEETENSFLCHYELVLPLGEYDIRKEDSEGEQYRNKIVMMITEPTRRTSGAVPCQSREHEGYFFDTPYRDGAHAMWDSRVLGNIPIKVIAPDGHVIDEPDDFKQRRLNQE